MTDGFRKDRDSFALEQEKTAQAFSVEAFNQWKDGFENGSLSETELANALNICEAELYICTANRRKPLVPLYKFMSEVQEYLIALEDERRMNYLNSLPFHIDEPRCVLKQWRSKEEGGSIFHFECIVGKKENGLTTILFTATGNTAEEALANAQAWVANSHNY